MIGVILAAGKGRRIESITNGLPKSFLLLGEKRLRVSDHHHGKSSEKPLEEK